MHKNLSGNSEENPAEPASAGPDSAQRPDEQWGERSANAPKAQGYLTAAGTDSPASARHHPTPTHLIRPINPSDGPRLQELLESLSEQSRFMRFIANIKQFSERQLARYTHVDFHRDMALAATTGQDESEKIIGVARYILLPDEKTAEFAIVVRDDFQNQGIGSELMAALFSQAKHQGLHKLLGFVLGNNLPMLHLMIELGFTIQIDPEDPKMRRVIKILN